MVITTTIESKYMNNEYNDYTVKEYGDDDIWHDEILEVFENLPYSVMKKYANMNDDDTVKLLVKYVNYKKKTLRAIAVNYTHIIVYFDGKKVMDECGETNKFTPLLKRIEIMEKRIEIVYKKKDINNPDLKCPVCFEDYSDRNIVITPKCNHKLCNDCLYRMYNTDINTCLSCGIDITGLVR